MIVDGKKIASDTLALLKERVHRLSKRVILVVFVIGGDSVTETFINLKRKRAEEIGIVVHIVTIPRDSQTSEIKKQIKKSAEDSNISGIVVQLPLPEHVDKKVVLASIPIEKDVDVLSEGSMDLFKEDKLPIIPPVVGAFKKILEKEDISIKGKNVVVVGKGALVGLPAEIWFKNQGADVTVVDRQTTNLSVVTKDADIIISGAGTPHLLKPEMLKSGVVLLDAGTSEARGKVVGDADPACADVCSIFTPVPGGIGPIAIAALLENLVFYTEKAEKPIS